MKQISLTQGQIALVDDEDFKDISKYKWQARKVRGRYYAGRGNYIGKVNNKYVVKTVHMHREVLKIDIIDYLKIQVDHINGNGLDNRKENLRLSSPSENRRNLSKLKSNNSTGFRGVTRNSNGTYRARIYIGDKRKHLGHFTTAKEAARAFDKAAIEIYGNFCGKLNFKGNKK